MARLSAGARAKLPSKVFAGPGRSFPIPDKAHAVAAERLVGRAEKAGSINAAQAAHIKAKAAAKLGKAPAGAADPHRVPGAPAGHFNYK